MIFIILSSIKFFPSKKEDYRQPNLIILKLTGNPAGIVKKNIEWKHENYGEYIKKMNDRGV
jgi:hypothetical protein